jgi:cytochrome oxidase Cu insertion factor (SCO1/SenC/PrrC family)
MKSRLGYFFLIAVLMLVPSASGYIGSQLSRGPVESFTLTDQNGDEYSLLNDSDGVVVVSFIFTRCPDVCPVLTQQLTSVEMQLSERELEDVSFISITVDPKHDTPEALNEYAERHGAAWPHLTGTSEKLSDVWATFGVVVQESVIEAHVMDYQPGESSLTVVDTNNNSTHHMFSNSGWTATAYAAEEAGWTLNTSTSQYGRMLHGINGYDSPEDWSWYWELNVWNSTSDSWEASAVGMDDLDVLESPHLAWMPSNMNRSQLPSVPNDTVSSTSVLWPNGTNTTTGISDYTAYHLTSGALDAAQREVVIDDSTYGHYLSSIDNVSAPEDYSWWWNLYNWNESSEVWETSNVGMDDLSEPLHIAWAPSYVNETDIPSPTASDESDEVCNGHGWHMGSGSNKHCMCDTNYTWAEDDMLSCVPEVVEDYTVGHSTVTYIMNSNLEPVVAWTGDNWRAEDFASDIQELLEKEEQGGYETEVTPSLSLVLTTLGLCAAAVAITRRSASD